MNQLTPDPKGLSLMAIRLFNALGKPFGINPFPRSFGNDLTVETESRAEAFDAIYQHNFWSSSESRSGVGSEVGFARDYRQRLETCLVQMNFRTIFDAPCGDLNWIIDLARDRRFTYTGGDISETLIDSLQTRFPDLELFQFDICSDPFPQADVWHCRDCLFHLPFEAIRKAFENFASSSISYALLTTHSARLHRNLDAPLGGFRYLDLERAPFCLPRARSYLKDYRFGRDFPRFVGLWSREDIARAVESWLSSS